MTVFSVVYIKGSSENLLYIAYCIYCIFRQNICKLTSPKTIPLQFCESWSWSQPVCICQVPPCFPSPASRVLCKWFDSPALTRRHLCLSVQRDSSEQTFENLAFSAPPTRFSPDHLWIGSLCGCMSRLAQETAVSLGGDKIGLIPL